MSLILICIPFIKGGNWIVYMICSIGIKTSFAMISWQDLGVYKLLGKQLLWSDTWNYFFVTLFILITIFF